MTINIKTTLSFIAFSLLMITHNSHCMKSNDAIESNDTMRKLIQKIDIKTTEIKNRFQTHQYPNLTGTITLTPRPTPGYGSASFIKSLNDANIPTQNKEAIVGVEVHINDTKNNKNTTTDWTKETPTKIMEAVYELADNLKNDIENDDDLTCTAVLNGRIDDECKKMQKTVPTHLPASLLLAQKINLNLFDVYPTELTFKQHKSLQQLILPLQNYPAAIGSLTPKTKKELQHTQWSNMHTEQEKNKKNKKLLIKKSQKTIDELEENDIVTYKNPIAKNVTIINNSTIITTGLLSTKALSTGYNNYDSKIGI